MIDKKYNLFLEAISAFDEGFDLATEYDTIPHLFGDEILHQAEVHTIQYIGQHKNCTNAMLCNATKKTPSACSQLVKKLIKKNMVTQIKNPVNGRENFLELTERGWKIFEVHEEFDNACFQQNYANVSSLSEEDLLTYIKVQKIINSTFLKNVCDIRAGIVDNS